MDGLRLAIFRADYKQQLRRANDRIRLLEDRVASLQHNLTELGASRLPHWWSYTKPEDSTP